MTEDHFSVSSCGQSALVCMDRAPMKKPIRVGGRQPVPSRAEKAGFKPGRRWRNRCKPGWLYGPKSTYVQGRVVARVIVGGVRMYSGMLVRLELLWVHMKK